MEKVEIQGEVVGIISGACGTLYTSLSSGRWYHSSMMLVYHAGSLYIVNYMKYVNLEERVHVVKLALYAQREVLSSKFIIEND